MLILAGVTIAALTSENGIINQANIVKEKNKVAKTEEEAKLEYSNLILEKQMEGHGEETELSDVIGKLEENGYETAEKDGKNYIKIGEYYYEIKLESFENAPNGKKGTPITKNSTNYRLSMVNVYKDYDGATSIDSIIANKWLSSYWKNNSTSTNSNIKAVAYILDTNAWNPLYRGENAEYAIGGPTVEMFVKSWNDTHSGDKQIECEAESNSNGYEVKFANGLYNTYIQGLAQNEYNSIYIKSDNSNANAMWLASPSAGGNYILVGANYGGYLSNYSYDRDVPGFRPVVCLKSKVKLQKVVDGYEIR